MTTLTERHAGLAGKMAPARPRRWRRALAGARALARRFAAASDRADLRDLASRLDPRTCRDIGLEPLETWHGWRGDPRSRSLRRSRGR
jgi:hypothetical protein